MKKKHIIIFLIVLLFSLFLSIGIIYLIHYFFPSFKDYKIESITEERDKLYLNIENSNKNLSYHVSIENEEGMIIYEKESNYNKIDISDLILDYNQKIFVNVTAKNKKNEEKSSSNTYVYKNKYASFQKTKDHFLSSNQYITLFLTNIENDEEYYMKLFYKNTNVYEEKIAGRVIDILYTDIESFDGKITAKLFNSKNRVVSEYNFYLNAPEISDFKITNPSDNYESIYDDIDVYYEGGENATTMNIKLYSADKKRKVLNSMTVPFTENHVIIPASLLKENTSYILELTAAYQDYKEMGKSDSINIHIYGKGTVKPVYVDKNFTFTDKNTEVRLSTDTKDATIYYTLDGTKPTVDSLIYNEPIIIDKDTTIETYASKKNMYDSDINTYDYKLKAKNLVVYLSPSNQGNNYGVKEAGYTTEKQQMNIIADYLEQYLKDANITVYRNKPNAVGGINAWLKESNDHKSDFHFAIHSNASVEHTAHGIEIYVDTPTSQCLSIASNIYKNLYEIYPNKDDKSNRGVKFARSSLGEVNDDFIKCGALIEVAYHDEYNDAKWIMENRENIARNMADTIIDFYQIK